MSSGMCDVTRESCEYILTKKGKGNSICIVVGGAVEALDAHPSKDYVLIVQKRKGFIRLALKTGYVKRTWVSSFRNTFCLSIFFSTNSLENLFATQHHDK